MLRRIRQHWKNYIGNSRMALIGCTILGIWIVLAVSVPLFGPWSYSEQNAEIRNQGASLLHWFGTDRFGRDLFTRVWYGAGISLAVGIISTLINGIIGVLYGAVSGYAGGRTDMVLMRIADIISAIPSMLYVILITLVMGAGVGSMILGLCVAGWISMARIVRGEIIKLKETEYAYAARMEGISPEASSSERRRNDRGQYDLPCAPGDFYRSFSELPRSGDRRAGGQPRDNHSGGAESDDSLSVSDDLPAYRTLRDAPCS